jgi:hypothetical protein
MNDATLPPAADTARRIYDEYYSKEPVVAYLENVPDDYDSLDEVIADDIRDFLHNGGHEDLGLNEDDSNDEAIGTALHDDFDYLTQVSLAIAALMTSGTNA